MSELVKSNVDYNEVVKPTLKTITSRIVSNFNPLKIILFGSYASGTPNIYSDIDILVVMPDGTDRREKAVEIKGTLNDLPYGKDIIVTMPKDIEKIGCMWGTVVYQALKEGVVLYE